MNTIKQMIFEDEGARIEWKHTLHSSLCIFLNNRGDNNGY